MTENEKKTRKKRNGKKRRRKQGKKKKDYREREDRRQMDTERRKEKKQKIRKKRQKEIRGKNMKRNNKVSKMKNEVKGAGNKATEIQKRNKCIRQELKKRVIKQKKPSFRGFSLNLRR